MTTQDGVTFQNVSTDDLAAMMMRGFSELRKDISNDIQGLGGRVDGVSQRLDALEHKVDRLEHTVDRLGHKMDTFEQKTEHRFDALSLQIKTISQTVYLDHEPRLEQIEKTLEIA